jgi:hypothetical protein
MEMDLYDWMFVLCAVAFNLLIAGIFIAQKQGRQQLTRTLGIGWLCLALPLSVVFVHYVIAGRETWILVYFCFILFYMLVELLLDYVFRVEFRKNKVTHIPYIILEYIALFGLIGISFAIDRTWGFIVSISFWVLLGCLIYLYWGKRKARDKV